MEVQYKRNYNDCYMVIETEAVQTDYEEQMIGQNEIGCLLSFYTMEVNHRMQFWYQITGKESLTEYFRGEGVTLTSLETLILSLQDACDEIKKYLLRQNRICLLPETVYLHKGSNGVSLFLCYCPLEMGDLFRQFQGIMEYVLTQLDESQQEMSEVCYQLYDITLQEHYQFSQLLACIREAVSRKSGVEKEVLEEKRKGEEAACFWEETRESAGKNNDMQECRNPFDERQEIPLLDPLPKMNQMGDGREYGCYQRDKKEKPKNFLQKIMKRAKQEIREAKEFLPMLSAGDSRAGKAHKRKLQYQGQGDEMDYIIDKRVFLIGSYLEENDACLHSSAVSRCHARIFCTDETCYLEDLGSKKGTFLNGERLAAGVQCRLESMDELRFGDVEYIFYA